MQASRLAPAGPLLDAMIEAADSARLGITVTAIEGDIEPLFISQAVSSLLGVSLERVRECGVWGFIAPDERPRMMALYEQRKSGTPPPRALSTVLLRPDGVRVPVEIATANVVFAGRSVNISFITDISELSRSEARFRRLIEGAPDGVVISRWPKILFLNRQAAGMFGLTDPAQAIGRDLRDFLHPDEVAVAEQRACEVLAGNLPKGPQEYTGRDVTGKRLAVEAVSIPIDYDGEPAGLAFCRDVTARKAMFAKLTQADKLAAVGTLAAGVAHEINNPLGYLLLNLGRIARELPDLGGDPQRTQALLEQVDQCRQGAEHVKTIVHDLQLFTRKEEDIRGPVDLEAVVVAATQLARHQLGGGGTRIKHELAPLPPAHGNPTRLEQLVLNLLINAAHAIEQSGRSDGVIRVVTAKGQEQRLLLRVIDNGIGIAPELHSQVFEPFFTTKPPGVGTGLGLPICHGIVHAIGGEIRLDSAPGRGTTVTVELNAHAPGAAAAAPLA